MKSRLQTELKQRKPFASLEAEAMLNLVRTVEVLTRDLGALLEAHGLTHAQYNVLRILRGAGKEGIPCTEISGRMVRHDPDITRLLDRMEKAGLATRMRSASDRRVVLASLTSEGLALTNRLDAPVEAAHRRHFCGVSRERLRALIEDLERVREKVSSGRRRRLRLTRTEE
jgi:DNA-binding MarR family transcriptional regulator